MLLSTGRHHKVSPPYSVCVIHYEAQLLLLVNVGALYLNPTLCHYHYIDAKYALLSTPL